ncbi:MAG: c-type cytochrome [Marinosulfonomonas sp.]
MKKISVIATALILAAGASYAEGDAAKGEKDFKKCKSCHMIANGDDVIVKGGKTGPNLYGVVGRPAGEQADYKYSKALLEARDAGLIWTEETLNAYVQDPKAFLRETLGDSSAKAKMTFKLKKPQDVVAYLASVQQ